MPKVSIVMPVYNSAKYLREAINSILEQTFTDWEFIIINELGSEDGSREIIEKYSEIDNRIILVQNEKRLGISASMNIGFDMAKGEYIARMDADDISLPNRFEKQVEFMDKNPDIGMCGVKVTIFGSNVFEWELEVDKDKLDTNILFYSPSVHPTVMIRKSLVDKYNLRYNSDFKASEDYELFSRICEVSKIANIDEVLFKYRIMENNATFKNNDIGLVLYSRVMTRQFEKMGLNFTDEEVKLLSPHYSMKGAKYEEVLEKFIKLDLLLKKILVANEECKLYSRKYLSNTLHKRFTEAYTSISWECKNYDQNKVDEFYRKSIFINEFFYEGYKVKKDFSPVVSVLMPAFNSEKYIADAIWNILNQSYENFELLIVNEFGSDDNTIKIINMFNDQRTRIIQNKEKLGLAESLNLGIREAKGKYIARVDADDLCDADRLKLQVEFMDSNPEYGVCGSWQHHFGINTDWIHKPSILHEDLKAEFIYNCELCHSTLMLRKSFFINNDLFYDKNSAAEDYELWTRAIHKFKFANLPRVLGEYRVGEDNITAKKLKSLSEESANIAFKNITTYLNVDIPKEHVSYLTGWFNEFNNIKDKKSYEHAINTEKEVLKKMWANNQKLKLYKEDSLLRVINRRWRMVVNSWVHGTELGEIFSIEELFIKFGNSQNSYSQARIIGTQRRLKKYLKGFLMFFYRPFKYKIIDKIIQQIWDSEGHLKDEINCLKNEIINMKDIMNNIPTLDIEEKSKLEILETLDGRIWKAELNQQNMNNNMLCMIEEFQGNVHRHIDFTYRDIMIVLEKKLNFINQPLIKLETQYPIAYESNDYKVPHGTIRDNTRYPRFVRKCEQIFNNTYELKFLDLGCSGGGMVLDAIIRGHVGIGLEGSDASLIQQRAEWRLLKNNLFTCDITKPFRLYKDTDNQNEKFDVITAWEVLEHIRDEELDGLFSNLQNHLSEKGIFVASIANWNDIDPVTGVNWHVNTRPYEWWKQRFQKAGFEICSEIIDTEDLARGGINPPHCFERTYDDYDLNKTFHIVVRKLQRI